MAFSITGNLVDIIGKKITPAEIFVEEGVISHIQFHPGKKFENFILPGFIDAHVHIESSMLIPSEFAKLSVVHGTVATISDPHEIANVCGLPGVEYMNENGKKVPFKFFFGAPSCVPATSFETAGARLDAAQVDVLLQKEEIRYLSEMMNYPAVLQDDEEVMHKINAAKKYSKPVDGHAPGLSGEPLKKYIAAGISTDHECFTLEEADEKLKLGMKIMIREGSAAKNFDALIPLLHANEDHMMFCSDDKHPDSLVSGHINQLCARAVAAGIHVFKVLKAACINPVKHYKLPVGLLQKNEAADFIVVGNLEDFEVLQTYIGGQLVAENKKSLITCETESLINQFKCNIKKPADFSFHQMKMQAVETLPVIEALDGQLITQKFFITPTLHTGVQDDILKIVIVNRYFDAPVAKAFIKNFGLKKGAIASSVAHDSHNIVAVGVDEESICKAINLVIAHQGGISCVGDKEMVLPLPVAGLMSNKDGYSVAEKYTALDKAAKELGSTLSAPFMTLSFMALLVIPHLKLSDKGLFDGDAFKFISLAG